MNPLNLLSSAGAAIKSIGLWGAAALGVTVTAEQATDNGKGGVISNFLPNMWKKWTETSSPEQGRNALLDNFFGGSAKIAGFVGALSAIVSLFSPELAKKLDNWLIDRSKNLSDTSRRFKETGDVNNEVLTPAARERLNDIKAKFAGTDPAAPGSDNKQAMTSGTTGLAATAVNGAALTAGSVLAAKGGYKGYQYLAAKTAESAATPAIKATSALSHLAGKGGKIGLIATGATIALGGTAAGIAALTEGTPSENGGVPTPSSKTTGTELAGVGAAGLVVGKAIGLKAIPVAGAVVTGYEGLKEVGSHLLKGEFTKATTSLVANGGLTVSALGGFTTYGLGEAWHAAVRDNAAKYIGENAKIAKAPVREAIEVISGINTDMYDLSAKPKAAEAVKPPVEAFKAAATNSAPIVVAPKLVEVPQYDIAGNVTGMGPAEPKPLTFGLN